MPALRMLKRRWSTATDDVPVLAFFPTLFHGVWTTALGVGWIVLGRPDGCTEGAGYSFVIAGLFFCFLASFLLGCWLIYEGLKGSIFETHLRWRVPYILYALHAVLAIEICINCYGSYLIHQPLPYCPTDPTTLWQPQGEGLVVVWTTWAIVAIILLMVISTYNMFPNYKDQKSWEKRCWCLTAVCCCKWSLSPRQGKGDKKRPPYARLAELFAQLFGAMDWAPSDLMAAFLLAGALQNARRRAAVYAALGFEASGNGLPVADGAADQAERAGRMKKRGSSFSSADVMLQDCFLDRPSPDVESGVAPLLTPSGLLAELRPDLTPEDAAKMQSGAREAVSDEDLDEAAHFSKFAFAAYGYMLYVWSKPLQKGWCMLCCGRRCGCLTGPLRSYQAAFSAGQWLPELKLTNNMNREAILQITGLPEEDVLFVRFEADVSGRPCLPYFIALDRATQSLVVCIRGTLSLDDCLTDAMVGAGHRGGGGAREQGAQQPSRAFTAGVFDRSFRQHTPPPVQLASWRAQGTAHWGILEAAKDLVADLASEGVLAALLEGRPLPRNVALRASADCRGWGVVVTGHSLGAGAAALVALYLRNFFPDTRAWAFSPPGGLVDTALASAATACVTSVAVGKDWVPRLSLASFERLRDDMIVAAARCRVPKALLLARTLCGHRWTEAELFAPHAPRSADAAAALSAFRNTGDVPPSSDGDCGERNGVASRRQADRYAMARHFRPPGRLMFLRPAKGSRWEGAARRGFEAVWIDAEELVAEGMLVSPKMMADHMPDRLCKVLQRLSRARKRQRVSEGGAAGPEDPMGPDFGDGDGDSDASSEEVAAVPEDNTAWASGSAATSAPGLSGVVERGPGNKGL
ncbi:hypothetical protein WJX81_002936 [Elliptochloris bilobata]|uniref:sn-1-specific diacylglycerol lipase n=1 Tax=Elliptochloris bilobata TaxID=381761 RepID=A0AAW1QY58_9CHLO